MSSVKSLQRQIGAVCPGDAGQKRCGASDFRYVEVQASAINLVAVVAQDQRGRFDVTSRRKLGDVVPSGRQRLRLPRAAKVRFATSSRPRSGFVTRPPIATIDLSRSGNRAERLHPVRTNCRSDSSTTVLRVDNRWSASLFSELTRCDFRHFIALLAYFDFTLESVACPVSL